MTRDQFLLMLLRAELWGTPVRPFSMQPRSCRELKDAASRQAVTGLLCGALTKSCRLGPQDVADTCATLDDLQRANREADHAVAMLDALLAPHAIRYVVVKGQTLAALYPHPGRRMPGDIDFYVAPSDFDRARRIIARAWSVDSFSADGQEGEDREAMSQHLAFEHDGQLFEMHHTLLSFASARAERRFRRLLDAAPVASVCVGGRDVPVLPEVLSVVYTFLHLYRHLLELGVGLRQFCDFAVLLDHYSRRARPADNEQLRHVLRWLGFEHAFCAAGWLCKDSLGLRVFPFPVSDADKRRARRLLAIVLRRGNMGQHGRRHAVRSGWRYCVEQFAVKFRHAILLFPLSPRECLAVIGREIPLRVGQALRRAVGRRGS